MSISSSHVTQSTESSFLHLIQQFEHDAKQLGILSPSKHLFTPSISNYSRHKSTTQGARDLFSANTSSTGADILEQKRLNHAIGASPQQHERDTDSLSVSTTDFTMNHNGDNTQHTDTNAIDISAIVHTPHHTPLTRASPRRPPTLLDEPLFSPSRTNVPHSTYTSPSPPFNGNHKRLLPPSNLLASQHTNMNPSKPTITLTPSAALALDIRPPSIAKTRNNASSPFQTPTSHLSPSQNPATTPNKLLHNSPSTDPRIIEMRNSNLEKMLHNLKHDLAQQEKLAVHYEKAFLNEKELTKQLNHQLDESAHKNLRLSNMLTEMRTQIDTLTDQSKVFNDKSRQELVQSQQESERQLRLLKEESAALRSENVELKENLRAHKDKTRTIQLELTQTQRTVKSVTDENTHLQSLIDKHDEYAARLTEKLNDAQVQLQQLQQEKHSDHSSTQDYKTTMQQELDEKQAHIQKLQTQINQLEESNRELQNANQKLELNFQQGEKLRLSLEDFRQVNAKLDRNNVTLHERLDTLLRDNTKLKRTLLDLQQRPAHDPVGMQNISKEKLALWRRSKNLLQQRNEHLQEEVRELSKENAALRARLSHLDSQQNELLNQTHTDFQTLQARYGGFVHKYEQMVARYKLLKEKNGRYRNKYVGLKEQLRSMKEEQERLKEQIDLLLEKER